MKIIKDNFNKYPKHVVCSKCESEILLEDGHDVIVHRAVADSLYVYEKQPYHYKWLCPLCKEFNTVNW